MPRRDTAITIRGPRSRHKVIGFVDAATGYMVDPAMICVRHKVIGFVDAATRVMPPEMRNLYRPPQGHWLRGCRDLYARLRF